MLIILVGIENNTYICVENLNYMPEIFRFFGFSFFFYSREHEPLHIHVEGRMLTSSLPNGISTSTSNRR